MKTEVYEKIRKIIAEIAEIDKEEIQDETHFVEDLDMDSMLALEVLAQLEKTFRIQIPEEKLSEFITLNKVYSVVTRLLSKNSTSLV